VAGLPVLLLTSGAISLLAVPLANALSRWLERRADRFALDLTRNPDAFIAAMRRMAAQNLSEENPSRLALGLFYTHPPVGERIRLAQQWARLASALPVPATKP
jgi:STE24 endopeptidase